MCPICLRGGLDNHCFGTEKCTCSCSVFTANLKKLTMETKPTATFYEKEALWGEAANGIPV